MEMKMNLRPYDGPPYPYKVLVNGKWRRMMGFDEEHICNQLSPKKPKKIVRIKEKNLNGTTSCASKNGRY
jgi:hypothetical protein